MKKRLLAGLAVLCASIFLLAGCASPQQVIDKETVAQATATASADEKQQEQSTLTLSATETVKVAPDVAYVSIGVRTTGASAQEAQQDNARIAENFLNAIKAQGISEEDIQTQNINIYQDYEDPKKTVMENTYKVTVKNVDVVGAVIDAAAAAGANDTYSLSFDVQDRDTVYMQALSKAMESVGGKAKAMAMAGGYTIIRPVSITESGAESGVMPYAYAAGAMDSKSEGGATQVTPQDIEVSATVSGTYLIQ